MTTPNPRKTAVYAQAAKASRPSRGTEIDPAVGREGSAVSQPAVPANRRPAEARAERDPIGKLFESARVRGPLTMFARAVESAGVAEALWGDGPFTVFAPTNRAFVKLPPGVLEALLEDDAELTRLVAGHIVAGDVEAPEEDAPGSATSIDGGELAITVEEGTFRVNEARIVKPRLRASNGIIRAIDTVLMLG